MRRRRGALVCGLVVSATLLATGASAAPRAADLSGRSTAYGLGTVDFVIGLPGSNQGTGAIEVRIHGGAVRVYQPGRDGLPVLPTGSRFGTSAVGMDINGDEYQDLLVGVPDLTVNGTPQAGAIQELFGSAKGFTAGPLITLGGATVARDGHFGTSISVVDHEALVGVPGATVVSDDGNVTPLTGAGEVVGFTLLSTGQVDQSSPEPTITMQTPQAGAHFGTIVSGDPTIDEGVVTAPDAHDGNKTETGYVEMSGKGVFGQRAGDRLGASLTTGGPGNDKEDGVLVGAPGRSVNGHPGAGAVEWFLWDIDGPVVFLLKTVTQASPGVPGQPQTNAHFGASVTSEGGFLGVREWANLIIGAPGHAVDGKPGAGEVLIWNVIEATSASVRGGWSGRGWTMLSRASRGVPGVPRVGAGFGAAVAALALSDADSAPLRLMVGIPRAHPSGQQPSGAVQVFHLNADGAVPNNVTAIPRAGGAEPGDQFGDWLSPLD